MWSSTYTRYYSSSFEWRIFFKYFFAFIAFCTTNFWRLFFIIKDILIFCTFHSSFFHSSFISCILTSTSVYNLEMIWISYHSCVLSIQTVQAVHKTGWFLGQISIKYLRIWMGSEMLVAEGWLWLKSIIKTGAKQMAKFWGFILLREDWAVTFDKWSITWTRQFWNEWEEYLLVVLVHTTTIACWLLCYKGQRHSTT